MRTLVVDDSRVMRMLVIRSLRQAGLDDLENFTEIVNVSTRLFNNLGSDHVRLGPRDRSCEEPPSQPTASYEIDVSGYESGSLRIHPVA